MQTAAAYIRVSTAEQAEYSPESQLRVIREFAKKQGLSLPDELVFIDEGLSGRSTEKRPAFQRMIALAKKKPPPFSAILLWKYSRFARSREDSVVYKSLLRRQCGVDVISVGEPLSGDKTSILIEALIEAMDEYYSINLAEEVRRGMGEKLRRGEAVCAPAFGYQMHERRFIPCPQTAGQVTNMFSLLLAGQSPREIAAALNAKGVRTARGGAFSARGVTYILTNPLYIGALRCKAPNGGLRVLAGVHEPLVSKRTFTLAQRALSRPREEKPRTPKKSCYPLKGVVLCSACGAPLVRAKPGSLQCAAYAKGRCRRSHSILESALTARIFQKIQSDFGGLSLEFDSLLAGLFSPSTPCALQREALKRLCFRIVFDREENRVSLIYQLSGELIET